MSNENELKLLTREETTSILEPTENLQFITIGGNNQGEISFRKNKDEICVSINNEEYDITGAIFEGAAHSAGIPRNYARRCPIDLLLPHINYWYNQGRRDRIKAIVKNRNLLGFVNKKVNSNPVSNGRMLSLAEQAVDVKNILGYHQIFNSLPLSTMAIVTRKSFEPIADDKLYGGLKIQNSILGENSIEVSPYVFRQWCSNGAITEESLGSYRRRDNAGLEAWVLETSEKACMMLDQEFQRIQHLTSIDVSNHLVDTVKGICKDKGVPVKIQEQILDEASRTNARTMYDVYNCFSKIASHSPGLSTLTIGRIQRIAGGISKENEMCPTCHRVLL